jgi:hypothetical protein
MGTPRQGETFKISLRAQGCSNPMPSVAAMVLAD